MQWLVGSRGFPRTEADSTTSASTQRPGPRNGQDAPHEPLQNATLDRPVYTAAEDLQTGPPNLVESSRTSGGSGVELPLPPGIHTMQEWGRTLLQFGKYKCTNTFYSDLYQSSEHEKMTYVDWVRTHVQDSSSPEFKDFAQYVSSMDLASGQTQSIAIPGSRSARRFKRELT